MLNLVTVSGRERVIWYDQQSKQDKYTKISVRMSCDFVQPHSFVYLISLAKIGSKTVVWFLDKPHDGITSLVTVHTQAASGRPEKLSLEKSSEHFTRISIILHYQ